MYLLVGPKLANYEKNKYGIKRFFFKFKPQYLSLRKIFD